MLGMIWLVKVFQKLREAAGQIPAEGTSSVSGPLNHDDGRHTDGCWILIHIGGFWQWPFRFVHGDILSMFPKASSDTTTYVGINRSVTRCLKYGTIFPVIVEFDPPGRLPITTKNDRWYLLLISQKTYPQVVLSRCMYAGRLLLIWISLLIYFGCS